MINSTGGIQSAGNGGTVGATNPALTFYLESFEYFTTDAEGHLNVNSKAFFIDLEAESAIPGFDTYDQITGRDITLISGGVAGSSTAPLRIAASVDSQGDGGVVNVAAESDIALEDTSGDLLIGRTVCSDVACNVAGVQPLQDPFGITSVGGDVTIAVDNGGIYDASGQTAASAITDPQTIWTRLGLIAPGGSPNPDQSVPVQVFTSEVQQNYNRYWQLLLNGSVDPTGTQYSLDLGSYPLIQPLASAALGGATPTPQQIQDYAQYLWTQTTAFFDNVSVPANTEFKAVEIPAPLTSGLYVYGADWRTNAEFDPGQRAGADPTFTFSSTTSADYNQIVSALTANEYWTPDELQYEVDAIAMNSATVGTAATPDIVGHNVTLTASGPIGRQGAPTQISVDELSQGEICTAMITTNCVTSDQLAALLLATAPGDITISGTSASSPGGVFTDLAFNQLPPDAVPVTLNVAETEPLFFSALGTLSITTPDDLFAQSTSPLVTIGTVSAALVNLAVPGDIYGASTSSEISSTGDTYLTATGDIAEAVNATTGVITPLDVNIGGTLVSARAGGDLGLEQVTGNLTFETGSIFATDNILLVVPSGDLVQLLAGCDPTTNACIGISGNGIDLQVPTGAVGTANTPLDLGLGTGDLTVLAPNGIYLTIAGSVNVESLSALKGPITLTATAGATPGDINLEKITSNGLVSLFASGGIYPVANDDTTDNTGCETPPTSTDVTACANSGLDAPSAVLEAETQIGNSPTSELPIHVADLQVNSFGSMWIHNYGNLTVEQVVQTYPDGLEARGQLYLSVGSDLTLTAPIDSGGGPVNETADGTITLETSVTSEGGTVTFDAGANMIFTSTGYIDASGCDSPPNTAPCAPPVSVTAEGTSGTNTGLVTMDSGSYIHGGAGTVDIEGLSDVLLTQVTSTNTVTVGSTNGSILDNNAGAATDITGGQIILTAGAAIGSGTDALLVDHTGSGDIGALSAQSGLWLTQTGGPLQISSATTTSGPVVLTVANSGATDQDLIMADSTSVVSAGGAVTLKAPGGNITLDQGATVTAGTGITATADDAVTLTGASLTTTGGTLGLEAGTTMAVHGGKLKSTNGAVSLKADAGSLTIDTSATVSAGTTLTGTASTTLTSSGASLTATSGLLSLTGGTGLSVDGGSLTATSASISLTATTGPLAIDQSATLTAGGGITVAADSGTATLTSPTLMANGGDVQITSSGDATLTSDTSVTGSTDALITSTGGSIAIHGGSVSATSGNVTLLVEGASTDGELTVDTSAQLSAGNGVSGTSSNSSVTLTGASVSATSGAIQFTAATGLTVDGGTVTATAGTMTLTADGGTLLIDDQASLTAGKALTGSATGAVTVTDASLKSTGASVSLTASGASNNVTVQTGSTISGDTTASLTANNGSVAVHDSAVTTTSGTITLAADAGSLAIDQASQLTSGGAINGSATTTVTLNDATLGATAAVLLSSGGDTTVDATASVKAGTTLTMKEGQTGAATSSYEGTFTGPLMYIDGGNSGDTITLAPVALNGYTFVTGGTGTNDIVLSLPTIDLADKLNSCATGPGALVNGTSAQGDPRVVQGVDLPLRNMVDVNGGSSSSTIEVDLSAHDRHGLHRQCLQRRQPAAEGAGAGEHVPGPRRLRGAR